MSHLRAAVLFLAIVPIAPTLRADVVLNEILYHAPNDLDDLQFIELHNTSDRPANLAGWKLVGSVEYAFPQGTQIEPRGYLVLCKDLEAFRKHYHSEAGAAFRGSLGHGKGALELLDARGKRIEQVKYRSRAPWPVAADGYSSTLERICPLLGRTGPDNWAPSPLPIGAPRAGGTPGKKNTCWSATLVPRVGQVTITPSSPRPKDPVRVEAEVLGHGGILEVEVRYREVGSGYEGEERILPMVAGGGGRFVASLPAMNAGRIVRWKIHAREKGSERIHPHPNEVRPALSFLVAEPAPKAPLPSGSILHIGANEFRAAQRGGGRGYGAPPGPPLPPRGNSAFVYTHPSGKVELFDFVHITPRSAGHKVRFHKDRPLDGMTTINLTYEYMDRFVLAEPLAFDLYRKAGNAAPRTDFVRVWVDGRPQGMKLLIEQPNKAFLRHNGLRTDGDLYKCQWFGHGLVGQHEKKTNTQRGHEDLVKLVAELEKTSGEAQWKLIQKHFDVVQVVNYFAVNMVLSHWDGFFNNYFTYHDRHGSGKWTMYPWDQDKTWGFHDGIRGYEVFTDMPLSFGMRGDRPPGYPKMLPPPPMFAFGPIWWRPGGHFSKPLLANERFRRLFLARTKELLETVYTEEKFGPVLEAMGKRIEAEFLERAKLLGQDPKRAQEHLRRNLDSLRDHLKKRRAFLLAQKELAKAGKFDPAEAK